MYIVKYSSGSWDDYGVTNVFVTDNLEIAEKWVNKFNAKVEYWKEILKQYYDEDGFLDEKYYHSPVSRWFWNIKDINNAFFDEIELR
jgi:hypothetical protein